MKYYFFTFFFISLFSFSQELDSSSFFGKRIDYVDIKDYDVIKNKILELKSTDVKIQGKILSSCPMKGCWMKMNVNNDTILVRFKDYGFFVPKNGIEGKSSVINGKISIDTLSIDQLKHYAEDAGKTKAEIALINEPEITISFLADGVIIKD